MLTSAASISEGRQPAPRDLSQYVAEYWEQGWTVVPDVFTQGEAGELAVLLSEICEEEQAAALAQNGALKNDGMTDKAPDGRSTPRKTGDPFHKRPMFRELATDGRLHAGGHPCQVSLLYIFILIPRLSLLSEENSEIGAQE
jgi:hypothetical protein